MSRPGKTPGLSATLHALCPLTVITIAPRAITSSADALAPSPQHNAEVTFCSAPVCASRSVSAFGAGQAGRFRRGQAAQSRLICACQLGAAWTDPVIPMSRCWSTPRVGTGRQLFGGDLPDQWPDFVE